MASVTFTGPGGSNPVDHILHIAGALQPTAGDGLAAGQFLRSRILERTAQGQDVDHVSFTPYAENHPYYYYPSGTGSGRQRGAAVGRLARKLKGAGKTGARTRLGLKFASYGDFKRSFGRGVVDLFGVAGNAPHMLMSVQVLAGGAQLGGMDEAVTGPTDQLQPITDIRVGFFDERSAKIAEGHNEGAGHLPRRHFFDANQQDIADMESIIASRIMERVRMAG